MGHALSNRRLTRDELNWIYQLLGANDADQDLLDRVWDMIETAESVAKVAGDAEAVVSFVAMGKEQD